MQAHPNASSWRGRVSSPLGAALLPVWMCLDPILNLPPPPDTAGRKFGDRSGELRICLRDLVDALAGNPKHLGCLRYPDKIVLHGQEYKTIS